MPVLPAKIFLFCLGPDCEFMFKGEPARAETLGMAANRLIKSRVNAASEAFALCGTTTANLVRRAVPAALRE